MLNIVLFGPPGAGKGTQSEKLIEKYKFSHLSTGDIFRKHLSEGTELGKMAQQYMNEGKLVPDEVTINMVKEKVVECKGSAGIIFDGFPRTVAQAQALDKMMSELGLKIQSVIALEVDEAEVKKRIEERRKVSGRADDESDKVLKRIDEYFGKTVHVLPYYKEQGRLSSVKGIGEIETIFGDICKVIDAAK